MPVHPPADAQVAMWKVPHELPVQGDAAPRAREALVKRYPLFLPLRGDYEEPEAVGPRTGHDTLVAAYAGARGRALVRVPVTMWPSLPASMRPLATKMPGSTRPTPREGVNLLTRLQTMSSPRIQSSLWKAVVVKAPRI